jgi:Mor family transcriptional regulator
MAVQFYDVLTEILDTHLPAKKYEAIKCEIITGIKAKLAGHQYYFKGHAKENTAADRHRAICAEYTGSNAGELMAKHSITSSWLKTILKRGGCNEKAF